MKKFDHLEYNRFIVDGDDLVFKFKFSDMGKITPILNGMELRGCVVYPIYYGFPGSFYKVGIRAKIKAPILFNEAILAEEMDRLGIRSKNFVYSSEFPNMDFQTLYEMVDFNLLDPFLKLNLEVFGADTPTCIISYKNIGLGIQMAFFMDGGVQTKIHMKNQRKIYPCVSFGRLVKEKQFIGISEKSSANMRIGAYPNRQEAQTVFSSRNLDICFKEFYPDSWLK